MSKFRNILALDSVLQGCGVGVCADGTISAWHEAMVSGHGERLMPMIEEVLLQAGVEYSDLDAVVATVGPGSFTGLRIGLSAAKSLGLALEIPVFGVTTLQALAWQYAKQKNPGRDIAVVLETKREDFYFQLFSANGEAVNEAQAVKLPAFKNADVIGDGLERFEKAGGDVFHAMQGYTQLNAGFIASLFYENNEGGFLQEPLSPVYLRGADVSTPKKALRPPVQSHLK